jgi:hypothetical protein
LKVGIALLDKYKSKVFTEHVIINVVGKFDMRFIIPSKTICPGKYSFDIATFELLQDVISYVHDICHFSIIETGSNYHLDENYGSVFVNCKWYVS